VPFRSPLGVWPFLRPFLLGPYRLPDRLTYREVVTRLGRLVRAHYPYLAVKGIDWDEAEASALARAEKTTTEADLARVLLDLFAVLRDGHVAITHASLRGKAFGFSPGLLLRSIGCRVHVERVAPDAAAAPGPDGRSGKVPPPGAEILTVNDRPVAEALAAVPAALTDMCSETTVRRLRDDYGLAGPRGTEVRLGWRGPAGPGSHPEETLMLRDYGRHWFYPAGESITSRLISQGRLSVGYVRIPSFYAGRRGSVLKSQFGEAFAKARTAPAMVIDVRANGGGSSLLSEWVAGHFLEGSVRYASFRCSDGRAVSLRVRGRRKAYTGPLVLLTDERTGSSAEGSFTLPLRRNRPRTWTVGRPTCGNAGNPICVYRYRGLVVRFPGAALVEPDGRIDLELTGIVPDYPVSVTVEDLLAGRDPDLAKALTVLEAALDPSALTSR